MHTSARNQFHGTVADITPGAVNAEVAVALPGGERIVATITLHSLRELALEPGAPVWALVKAPSVLITADEAGVQLSARNRLCGRVARVTRGAVNADVMIELPGGSQVSAVITNESVDRLALAVGARACAVFKAGSVILAVKS